MMPCPKYSVVLFFCVATLALAAPASTHKADGSSDVTKTITPSEITVERMDPKQVAFLLHQGAYWTIGPEFVRVREHMKTLDQPGPLYVRYRNDPRTVPPQSLHTEIGFFFDGAYEPGPPYQMVRRNSELVARMLIDGPFAIVSRHFAMLHAWANAHDYVAVGPITEIYPETDRRGERAQWIELQMVIEPRIEPIDQGTATSPETPIKEVMGPPTAGTDAAGVSPAPPPKRHAETVAAGGGPLEPTVAGPIDRKSGDAGAPATSPGEPAGSASRASGTKDSNPVRSGPSIRALAAEQRFDRIAEEMLPGDRIYSPDWEIWLGHVVFRIRAIARGIEQAHPDDRAAVSALAGAIDRRLEQVSGSFTLKPLDHLVIPSAEGNDPDASEKRAILHELDVVMARIGLKSIDAPTTFDLLLRVAQRTADLMDSNRP